MGGEDLKQGGICLIWMAQSKQLVGVGVGELALEGGGDRKGRQRPERLAQKSSFKTFLILWILFLLGWR